MAHKAAPGELGGELRGGDINGNAVDPSTARIPAQLPERIRDRLSRAGVANIADWLALGRRRYQIFGVTRAMVRDIDAAIAKVAS